jgi:hypothetical protein
MENVLHICGALHASFLAFASRKGLMVMFDSVPPICRRSKYRDGIGLLRAPRLTDSVDSFDESMTCATGTSVSEKRYDGTEMPWFS